MIARRRSDDTAALFLIAQQQPRIARAALLETAGAVQVFELTEDLAGSDFRKRNTRRAWRSQNCVANALGGALNFRKGNPVQLRLLKSLTIKCAQRSARAPSR